MTRQGAGRIGLLILGAMIVASSAAAQQASGLAGVVRDTSGAVLPGVTVEAASPALIEKVRTVVTDGEGRYSIVDLRPGVYSVTFTLPGFTTIRREGIELPVGFTATVTAEMRVGAVEETVTVSGAAPVVDTRTVRQQKVLSSDTIAALPTGNTGYATLISITAGFGGGLTQVDVGGTRDTWAAQGGYGFFHGKPGTRSNFDGFRNQYFVSTAVGSGYIVNSDTVSEFQLETSGMQAESGSGTTVVNAIPKEGGNALTVMLNGKISTSEMQGSNLTQALRDRGLTTEQEVQKIYKAGATVGGPIRQDRMWFFGAVGRWGMRVRQGGAFFNKTQGTVFYTPDPDRPADNYDFNRTHAGRLTWQVASRHKVAVFGDIQDNCRCTTGFTGANAIESQVGWDHSGSGIVQGTWNAPMTNRLLLEAGVSHRWINWNNITQPGVTRDHISILEQSTNFRYGAPSLIRSGDPVPVTGGTMERFSVSYVTGSHTFKTGITVEQAFSEQPVERSGPDGVGYQFLRGVPVALDFYAIPYRQIEKMKAEVGVYAQDQWVIQRLTLNLGLRFDYMNSYVPEQHLPAGPFVPARDVAPIYGVPRWKDWNPRFGASYDVFGNGRTAIKVSMGRYVELSGSDLTLQLHPLTASFNTAFRAWRDIDGDYVPDCDLKNFADNGECGPISNQNFGKFNPNATRFDYDNVVRANRKYLWDFGTEVQHELRPGLSVSASYAHNWDRNFRVTDNELVTPGDHSSYCITAPSDPGLPGGGGYQVCGLYDVSPAKFGQFSNFVTLDSKFGVQERVWDGVSLSVDGRFARGLRVGGSFDTGRSVMDNCFVIDSPGVGNVPTARLSSTPQTDTTINGERACRIVTRPGDQMQFKMNASYPLPGGFLLGAVYQNLAGPAIEADYPATSAEIAQSLGRPLSGGSRFAVVPLIMPQTEFEDRFHQLDLRMSKIFRVGRYRLQGNVDLYNALNSSSILSIVTTYGPRWRRPLSILDARLLQLSGQISF